MRAVIDIGTNSVLMLVAKKKSNGAIELGTEKVMITRLGEGLTETGCISKEGEERTIAALKSFLQTCGAFNVAEITAASNALAFIKRVKSELGIDIEIMGAEKEARLTYEASSIDFGKDIIVVDIGGGSTEFIKGPKPLEIASLPIGSVSLTEDFIHSDPVSDDDESELRTSIFDHLLHDVPIETSPETQNVIATAGTATTLMAMHFEVEKYDSKLIHGQKLSIDAVAKIIDELRERSVEERKELVGLQPERAEVIFAGAVLFHEVMKHLGLREITVSDRGLRWGLFYEKFCAG
ncbi:MAG: Exopolyphosphatase [bacterium ADurb.Bin270]|nr:MAG: Exopolyphosphatase [bacterium ADurb.Bin270]